MPSSPQKIFLIIFLIFLFQVGWKANILGTDLNLQFPAGWKNAKEIKYAQGFNKPAPRDFVGLEPLSEPESLAIYNFTLIHDKNLLLHFILKVKKFIGIFKILIHHKDMKSEQNLPNQVIIF